MKTIMLVLLLRQRKGWTVIAGSLYESYGRIYVSFNDYIYDLLHVYHDNPNFHLW